MSSGRPSSFTTAQRRNIIIIAIIFVGVTALSLFRNTNPMELDFGDDHMTITGPESAPFTVTVQYQDILSVSEADIPDPGICLEGLDTQRCRFGFWQNDTYGEYTLCDSPAFQDHIVLETADGIVAFNYESDDSTHHLCQALVELLRDHGLEV